MIGEDRSSGHLATARTDAIAHTPQFERRAAHCEPHLRLIIYRPTRRQHARHNPPHPTSRRSPRERIALLTHCRSIHRLDWPQGQSFGTVCCTAAPTAIEDQDRPPLIELSLVSKFLALHETHAIGWARERHPADSISCGHPYISSGAAPWPAQPASSPGVLTRSRQGAVERVAYV